jgi:hypothetical protein
MGNKEKVENCENEIKIFVWTLESSKRYLQKEWDIRLVLLDNLNSPNTISNNITVNDIEQHYVYGLPWVNSYKRLRKEIINWIERFTMGDPKDNIGYLKKNECEKNISWAKEFDKLLQECSSKYSIYKKRLSLKAIKNSLGSYCIDQTCRIQEHSPHQKENCFDLDIITRVNNISLENNPLIIFEWEGKEKFVKKLGKDFFNYGDFFSNKKLSHRNSECIKKLYDVLSIEYPSESKYYSRLSEFCKQKELFLV